ncbi:protein kinase [Streptomyces sp. NPDC005263]|uniref:serine/threonine-protein kinase n=1 Tax=Streptomyces sp. NPDC005263 TaxID=3364711 RepID=UPI0036A39B23
MGRVWRAADDILDRQVAVKEMRIDGLDAEDARTRRERTLREARATARIDHPNVVRVYDVVDEGERLWIVMELVSGRSLERIMAEEGPLGPRETARLGLGLVEALRQVHERGVLHRDIKPGNVLVEHPGRFSNNPRVVLTDFGIAAIQDAKALTMVGMLVGSPDYMAPERISGRPQGPPSDVWSLGATLCAALGGHSPFSRDTTLATLHAVLYEEPELPAAAGPLRDILAALLHKEPEARPGLAALEASLRPLAFPPPTPTAEVVPAPLVPGEATAEPVPDPETPATPIPEPAVPEVSDAVPVQDVPPDREPGRTRSLRTLPDPRRPAPTPAPEAEATSTPDVPAPANASTEAASERRSETRSETPSGNSVGAVSRGAGAGPEADPAAEPPTVPPAGPPAGPPSTPDHVTATGPRPLAVPPAQPPGPAVPSAVARRGRRGRRDRRRAGLVVAAGVVAAGAVVAIVLAATSGPPDTTAGSTPSVVASSSPVPSATASDSPTPTVGGTSRPRSLPPGAHQEAGGFAWATPRDWRRDVKTGAEVHYTSPDGRQELAAKSALARGDLMETWETSEQNAHQGQNYRKIRLEETTFRGHPAVVWEYTFTLQGVPWHARLLGFTAGGKSYQINTWYQPDIETRALKTYGRVRDSFTVL